jgi:fatty acid desaturase
MDRPEHDSADQPLADPDWFREPTVREHWIAAGLFVGFGVFFLLLFVVLAGWWFRWVILALGVYSILHGLRHAADTRHQRCRTDEPS